MKAKKIPSAKLSARTSKAAGQKKTALDIRSKCPAAADPIVLDRRASEDRRKGEDRRKANMAVATDRRHLERRQKTNRRRQIDPTTCERNYTPEEIEFMTAIEGYKRTSGRMFPTCSEILEVLRTLGYEKRPPVAPAAPAPITALPNPATVPASGVTQPAVLG